MSIIPALIETTKHIMETKDIYRALKSNNTTRDIFVGVYPSDKLPAISALYLQSEDTKQAYVINLDPSHLPGSHWVAVFCDHSGNEYFDSYGLPPILERITRFLGKNNKIPTLLTCI